MVSFLDNSECAMFPPETKVCGPGGLECVPGNASVSAVCECIAGWTNFGDFALSPSGPCDMNIMAIRALWAIMSIANFFAFLGAIWFLWRKLEGSGSFEEMRGKFDGASLTVLYLGLDGLCFTISGALRAANPLRFIVGGELSISFVYSLGLAFFWFCALNHFSNIVTVAYKNLRMKSDEAKVHSTATLESIRKLLPGLYVLMFLLAFLPFVMAIVNTSAKGTEFVGRYDQVIAGIHFMGVAIMELVLGICMIPRWLDSIVEDCETVINLGVKVSPRNGAAPIPNGQDSRTERLKNTVMKFKFFKSELRKQGATNGILSIFFGCWQYLTHKSSYIIPFNITCGAIVGILIIWSLSNFSVRASKGTTDDGTTQKSSGSKKAPALGIVSSPRSNDDVTFQVSYTELHREHSAMSDD